MVAVVPLGPQWALAACARRRVFALRAGVTGVSHAAYSNQCQLALWLAIISCLGRAQRARPCYRVRVRPSVSARFTRQSSFGGAR